MMQPSILHFRGGREAFDYARHNMEWNPEPGAILPALVEGVVFMQSTGLICKVRLPTGNGDTTIVCPIRDAGVGNIHAGDWVAIWVDTEAQEEDLADLRALIVARLTPSYDIGKQAWLSAPDEVQKPPRLLASLNTPFKRIGAITLAAGLVLTAIWIFSTAADSGSYRVVERLVNRWGAAVFQDSRSYHDDSLAAWGAYLAFGGLLCSYLYEQTVGRLVTWIRRGNS